MYLGTCASIQLANLPPFQAYVNWQADLLDSGVRISGGIACIGRENCAVDALTQSVCVQRENFGFFAFLGVERRIKSGKDAQDCANASTWTQGQKIGSLFGPDPTIDAHLTHPAT
jgi:hypothetical protein